MRGLRMLDIKKIGLKQADRPQAQKETEKQTDTSREREREREKRERERVCVCVCVRERERERERETETEAETDRDRQTDRQTETDRQTGGKGMRCGSVPLSLNLFPISRAVCLNKHHHVTDKTRFYLLPVLPNVRTAEYSLI